MIHEIIVEIEDEDFHKHGLDGCREVIRCKDCRFYREEKDQDDLCVYRNTETLADDYCSRAMRKGEQE